MNQKQLVDIKQRPQRSYGVRSARFPAAEP